MTNICQPKIRSVFVHVLYPPYPIFINCTANIYIVDPELGGPVE